MTFHDSLTSKINELIKLLICDANIIDFQTYNYNLNLIQNNYSSIILGNQFSFGGILKSQSYKIVGAALFRENGNHNIDFLDFDRVTQIKNEKIFNMSQYFEIAFFFDTYSEGKFKLNFSLLKKLV